MKKYAVIALAAALSLVVAAPAMGFTEAQKVTATNGPGGNLPFTGMDLAIVAGAALTMVAAGLALRRLSAPRTPGV